MAFIRNCVIAVLTVFCIVPNAKAQVVYYPAQASQLTKATAADAAMLLQSAIPGSQFTTQPYTVNPTTGIVLIYDTTITDNQACKVIGNGNNYITFTAAEDNGLHYGIYQYLQQNGFRFYLPGTAWQITPMLTSAFKNIDTTYTCNYKYKTWFISGGHSRWMMDNATNSTWGGDAYAGENGHNWSLYQRRNGMLGSASFQGHRGDIMSGNYLATLKTNPCYVANFNGSRQADMQSVPDIFNNAAKDLWANTIEQKYTQYKNTIYVGASFYKDLFRNFKYNNDYIGIEVPDVAKFGNSKENDVCNAVAYPKESDQHFALANYTAEKILAKYPNKRFHLYAYSGHADVPSASIVINKNIDIQLAPTVYQVESSTAGLRNRWYNRSANISEYLYLNLSGWSGETPMFSWGEMKKTLAVAKEKKSQGVVWEASPAKFGSLPYLLAANSNLITGKDADSTLQEFCNNMFGNAAGTIYKMLQMFGDEKTTVEKNKIQLYLQLLKTASDQLQTASSPIVTQRLQEMKAYLHYMVLYFALAKDDRIKTANKEENDAALCIYLAKTNKLQLVNSYYVIGTIAGKYGINSSFYAKYNVNTGTAYLNGSLPLITNEEIENNFIQDYSKYGNVLQDFVLENAASIKPRLNNALLAAKDTINVKLGYTNGLYYFNKTTFNIIADKAGSFTTQYLPRFKMDGYGYINFVVENADKALQVVKDFTIDNTNKGGTITFNLPQAGNYVLTVISKYQSAVDLTILTNGNYFYKNGAFLGTITESYRDDTKSFPGYFYVPSQVSKVYFTVNNGFSGGKFTTAVAIGNTFGIKDNKGNTIQPKLVTPADSTLFYFDVPETAAGTFWQATTMAQYNLSFVNISNALWFTQPKAASTKQTLNPAAAPVATAPLLYPNPSTGVFNCRQNGSTVIAQEIVVYNTQGTKIGSFKNANQFNISNAAAGTYFYQMVVNGVMHKGKMVKM